MDFLLPIWNPFVVEPLTAGLRALATPLESVVSPGVAGGLAIIFFTLIIRLVLLPLSLAQVRSQKAMMALQPEIKALEKKFKGDREGKARAQMTLYKERGVNPAAGCLPMVVQLPILFGMYWALLNLSTGGLALDQVQTRSIAPGEITYGAERTEEPLPTRQFTLTHVTVVPTGEGEVVFEIPRESAEVSGDNAELATVTQGLTLNTGAVPPSVDAPATEAGEAAVFVQPAGLQRSDGTLNREAPVADGEPYVVDIVVSAPGIHVDQASATMQFDPSAAEALALATPELENVPFKSGFLWLESLGEPDVVNVGGFGAPGFLLIIMTITAFASTRMIVMPSSDPQQQMMMKMMGFMPLMYLFFFLATPSGLVLYWFTSNLFTIGQQYFTVGLGKLSDDLYKFTGRNFQPSWAAVPATTPVSRNGRTSDDPADDEDGDSELATTTTPGQPRHRSTGSQRRTRTAAGKGRKRGRR